MTDKLKCPFCGEELAPHIDEWKSIRKLFICNNTGCFCWGQPMLLEIWQALIVGKKAQDALKIVDGKLKVIANDENPSPIQSQALDCYIQIAKDCRDTITSITKQEI